MVCQCLHAESVCLHGESVCLYGESVSLHDDSVCLLSQRPHGESMYMVSQYVCMVSSVCLHGSVSAW